MKKVFMLAAAVMLFCTSVGFSEELQEKKLGVTFSLDYHSQWLSKGAPAYKKQGAVFETLDLDFWQSGFGVKVTHRSATSSGFVDKQRFDYRPYYKGKAFVGERYQIDYDISVGYENYYGMSRKKANTTWEWIYSFGFPNILPKGFKPKYIAHYESPAFSGERYRYVAGWVHRFLLGYDLEVPQLSAPLTLSSEIAYSGGLGGANHDWSYATLGASTSFKLGENVTFTPGIYYQMSMEDSVCDRDVMYTILSLKYKF
ncbi:MAG: hypothetical protein JW806_07125 [Sedimentisphaerales bacterium]|nr:hypothetical protein [Sedimentisphaerales bacterium]